MRIEDYTVLFKKQKQMLYGMLLNLVREKTSFSGDLGPLVKDLIDLAFTEGYLKILEGGLSRLPPELIITRKAKDVFYEAIRVPKKQQWEPISPEVYEQRSLDPDPYQRMVLQEDVQTLDSLLDEASRKILEDTVDGVSSRLTAAELGIAVKTLRNRRCELLKRVRQHLTEGF